MGFAQARAGARAGKGGLLPPVSTAPVGAGFLQPPRWDTDVTVAMLSHEAQHCPVTCICVGVNARARNRCRHTHRTDIHKRNLEK